MKPNLIIITGVSRSGKDTLASEFINHGYRGVNMARGMKDTIENLYGLPRGAMEIDRYRNHWIPGTPYTYLGMMVELAKTWREIDPACMTRNYARLLLENQVNTVTTGVRFPNEAQLFSKGSALAEVYNIKVFEVTRPGAVPLASDSQIPETLEALGYREILGNYGTLGDYQNLCKRIAQETHENLTYQRTSESLATYQGPC